MTATVDTETEVFTLSEAADYLNRSIGFFNAERKEILVQRGAKLGGRGQGSTVPKSLLDELKNEGWGADVKATRARRSTGVEVNDEDVNTHPDVRKAVERAKIAADALTAAEAEVVRWKQEVREANKHVTAVRRDVTRQLSREVKEKKPTVAERRIVELEAEAEKIKREQKRIEARLAKARAKAEGTAE